MIARLILAALLVVGGVAALVAAAGTGRSLLEELRAAEGRPGVRARQRRMVAAGVAVTLAVLAVPVVLFLAGAHPAVVVVAGLLVAGVMISVASELRLVLRGRGYAFDLPWTVAWQRRIAVRLARALAATRPVPPLRPVMRTRPRPPSAPSSSRHDRRLLVVRLAAGETGLRLWDLADTYLGSSLRYRDLLALNSGRVGPDGAPITEESVVGDGWTILMPGDARGPDLVALPVAPPEPVEELPDLAVDAVLTPVTPPPEVLEVDTTQRHPAPTSAVPEPASPSTPSVAPIATPPVPESPGTTDAKSRYPRVSLPWDLAHARLAAEGLLRALDSAQARRARSRPRGAGVQLPDAEALAVEEAAALGADHPAAHFLDAGLRLLSHGLAGRATAAPDVLAVHLGADLLECRLGEVDRNPPAPFEASESGRRWLLDRGALVEVPDAPRHFPRMVSLGSDKFGRLLVNLPAGDIVTLEGEPNGCRMVALAMAAELALKAWSQAPVITLAGIGHELSGLGPRVRIVERVEDVLVRRSRGHVIFTDRAPADKVVAALRVGAASDHSGAPAIVVLGADARARWRLQLAPNGVLSWPDIQATVGAQAIRPRTASGMARLLHIEGSSIWPGSSSFSVPLAVRDRHRPDETEVLVRLVGVPRLERNGTTLTATDEVVQILAFLALTGATTLEQLASAVWPGGNGRADVVDAVHRAGVVVGAGRSEGPLVQIEGEYVRLAASVATDWQAFLGAMRDGDVAGARATASEWSSGGRSPVTRHYPWMARLPVVRQLPLLIEDIAAENDVAEISQDDRASPLLAS